MRKANLLLVLLVLAAVPGGFTAREAAAEGGGSNTSLISGRIIVVVDNSVDRRPLFRMEDGRARCSCGEAAENRLSIFDLKRTRIAYHRRGISYYELRFNSRGREAEIISYIRSLPGVKHAWQDFAVTLCVEPNDFYYQPDETDTINHWIPSILRYPNTSDALECILDWDVCCPHDSVHDVCYTYYDSLHMSDQWYLQKVQANEAWNIERGDPDVTVMIMDSGVAIEHQDLAANIWTNEDDSLGDDHANGLPGDDGDDDGDGGADFNDPEIRGGDINGNGIPLCGPDGHCDAGPDGDYGFGSDAIDNDPPGPGGGDDALADLDGTDPWDDNLRGPGSAYADSLPDFDDDMEDVQFMKRDDDENGWPDDIHGANFIDPVKDWAPAGQSPDGLPGLKGWDVEYWHGAQPYADGKHFNDEDVREVDFDGDGVPLCGPDGLCDAGEDGDYGFGPDGVDDDPPGPGGEDDAVQVVGYDPWDDNRRGPGSAFADSLPKFDDDMDDVRFMRYDNEEDGDPISHPVDDGCPKSTACHGTQMAGIVGAVTDNGEGVAGFVWHCKLLPAKIAIGYPEHEFDKGDTIGASVAMIAAFDYAMDNDVDVINMSLTILPDDPLYPIDTDEINEAIDRALAAGIVLVASAGNEYVEISGYPCSYPGVISVAGTTRKDTIATYSSYHSTVDVCAPVADTEAENWIYNTYYPGCVGRKLKDRGSECMTTAFSRYPRPMFPPYEKHCYASSPLRTSGAAAQVSGLAAMLVSMYSEGYVQQVRPGMAYNEFIRGEILRGAEPLDDTLYDNGKLGAGRINAYRSLTRWGRVSSDTTWTQFAYLSGDLVVEEGATLTIGPGTVVKVADYDMASLDSDSSRIGLWVAGHIDIQGTAGAPVVFRSLSSDPQPGDWKGIRFIGSGPSGSIAHCEVRDAEYGVMSGATISMSDCDVHDCYPCGVYLYESGGSVNASSVTSCSIHDNDSTGADGMRIWNCSSTVTVDSCEISSNYRGLWISNASPAISRTDIDDNAEYGVYVTRYQAVAVPAPTFSSCRMRGNGQVGIYFDCSTGSVSETRISGNGSYGVYCFHDEATPEFHHVKIVDNGFAGVRTLGASPVLGDTTTGDGQYNAIDNERFNVYVAGMITPTVMAQNCWWGTGQGQFPDTRKFYPDTPGVIVFQPYLDGDPVVYLARSSARSGGTTLMLAQNVPNPFSGGGTTIRYQLPKRGRVTIRLYDVAGRRVRTLVDGTMAAGSHAVTWDARNEGGRAVAPGIYFCRMSACGRSMTKKIILLHE